MLSFKKGTSSDDPLAFLWNEDSNESYVLENLLEKKAAGYFVLNKIERTLLIDKFSHFSFTDPRWILVFSHLIKSANFAFLYAMVNSNQWFFHSPYKENWCHLLFKNLYEVNGFSMFGYLEALLIETEKPKTKKKLDSDVENPMSSFSINPWAPEAKELFYQHLDKKRAMQESGALFVTPAEPILSWPASDALRDVDWHQEGIELGNHIRKSRVLWNQKDCSGVMPWMYAMGLRGLICGMPCSEKYPVPQQKDAILLFLDALLLELFKATHIDAKSDAGDSFLMYVAFSQSKILWDCCEREDLLTYQRLEEENDSGLTALGIMQLVSSLNKKKDLHVAQ